MAKYLDDNGLLYFWGKIKAAFVAKDGSKVLSDNNYTTAEKNKLSGIDAGAEVNVIDTVKVNGTALAVTSKAVDVTVPTGNNTAPIMDGTADAGSATTFARGDHVHPTDTSRAAADHVHGAITNDGKITATAVALANNDALVFVDASDSNKIKKSTTVFNGSTTTKALTQKGTFETFYQKPSSGIPSSDMASAVQTSLGLADTAYQKPSTGIPSADMASAVQTSLGLADTAYQKPSTGIPDSDMADSVQTSLGLADTAYQKPSTGIPKADLVSSVQSSLAKADNAYQKPSTGIPSADMASAVQTSLHKADTAYQKPSSGIPGSDLAETYLTEHQSLAAYAPLASPGLTGTPTAPTASDGTNTTQIATTAFVNTAINNSISQMTGISYEVVQTLPASGVVGTIYLVAHSHGSSDTYDEYIWVNNAFEKIGNTDVDLTGYWAKTELVAITNAEIDTIVAS